MVGYGLLIFRGTSLCHRLFVNLVDNILCRIDLLLRRVAGLLTVSAICDPFFNIFLAGHLMTLAS